MNSCHICGYSTVWMLYCQFSSCFPVSRLALSAAISDNALNSCHTCGTALHIVISFLTSHFMPLLIHLLPYTTPPWLAALSVVKHHLYGLYCTYHLLCILHNHLAVVSKLFSPSPACRSESRHPRVVTKFVSLSADPVAASCTLLQY